MSEYLFVPVTGINKSDVPITMSVKSWCINGWEIDEKWSSTFKMEPGNKKKLSLYIENVFGYTDVTTIDDVEYVEIIFETYNTETYKPINKKCKIRIVMKQNE